MAAGADTEQQLWSPCWDDVLWVAEHSGNIHHSTADELARRMDAAKADPRLRTIMYEAVNLAAFPLTEPYPDHPGIWDDWMRRRRETYRKWPWLTLRTIMASYS